MNSEIMDIKVIRSNGQTGGIYMILNNQRIIKLMNFDYSLMTYIKSDYKAQILRIVVDKLSTKEFNINNIEWAKVLFSNIICKDSPKFEQIINSTFYKVLRLYSRPIIKQNELVEIKDLLQIFYKENLNNVSFMDQVNKKICYF